MVLTEGGPPDRRGYRIVRDRLGEQGQPREESFLIWPFQVAIHMKNGQWLTVQPGERRGLAFWQQRLLLWFAVSTVVFLIPVAWLFRPGPGQAHGPVRRRRRAVRPRPRAPRPCRSAVRPRSSRPPPPSTRCRTVCAATSTTAPAWSPPSPTTCARPSPACVSASRPPPRRPRPR
ncbi:MAG: hypothetical protein WDN45_01580 [Caulobacteraceae bacterium]